MYKYLPIYLGRYLPNNNFFIHNNWVQQLPAAIYSASAIEREIEDCFRLNQATRLVPTQKHPPKLLFLSSAFPAQSASEYPASIGFVSLEKQIP
jgi:hypothetical protein